MNEMAEKTKKTLKTNTIEVVADKGYESRKDILKCIYNGTVPNVALKYDKKERLYNLEYKETEITEETKKSTKQEDIKKCLESGVLPECFKDTNVNIEVQEQNRLSCFILNDDGTVTCPMGNTLSRIRVRGKNTVYANKDACRQCPNKCTGSQSHKTVSFGPNTKYVPVKMYGSPKYELQEIPKDIVQNTPYNSLNRKDHPQKKVVIRIRKDKKKLKERKKRLEKLTSGQLAGKATKEAVEAIQAAILVCAVVPVIITGAT